MLETADGVTPPAVVRRLAQGSDVVLVWENELGGRTFRIDGTPTRYVKWFPKDVTSELRSEADRLRWAGQHLTVPHVIEVGDDQDGSWIVTVALRGDSAVSSRWLAEPGVAVAALGQGLRRLHDSLPVTDCPFSWAAADRVAEARELVARGVRDDPQGWHEEHRGLTSEQALRVLADIPPVDRLVVCHGDACAPNTLLDDDGQVSGYVDLGALGVADRWADLAIATWSTNWNYGPGWEGTLLDAYGVVPDPRRTAYYRLLWDLGP